MTRPTKAIAQQLLNDFARVSNVSAKDMLFDEQDVIKTMERIEVINYHAWMEVSGINFTCYNAGHVLGAAMFMIEIGGTRILYTGDFTLEEDRHLCGAEIPPPEALTITLTIIPTPNLGPKHNLALTPALTLTLIGGSP